MNQTAKHWWDVIFGSLPLLSILGYLQTILAIIGSCASIWWFYIRIKEYYKTKKVIDG